MGSTANKHGHVIAANITGGSEKFAGIVGTACVKVFAFNTGRVGLGEKQAIEAGFDVVTALISNRDRPAYYPGSKEVVLKLIVDKNTRRIVGGQGTGPGDVIKRIDVLAAAITMGMTVDALAEVDLAYAPPYNTATDALHHAANLVRNKLAGRTAGVSTAAVNKKIKNGHNFVLLDIRGEYESDNTWLEAPQLRSLQQLKLYDELDTIDKNAETLVLCQRGVKAYEACCLLKCSGCENVKFVEGGLTCWYREDVCGEPLL